MLYIDSNHSNFKFEACCLIQFVLKVSDQMLSYSTVFPKGDPITQRDTATMRAAFHVLVEAAWEEADTATPADQRTNRVSGANS